MSEDERTTLARIIERQGNENTSLLQRCEKAENYGKAMDQNLIGAVRRGAEEHEARLKVKDLQRQLAQGPCGVPGHRNADQVELGIVAIGDEMYYCSLCRREQEIRREERERISSLVYHAFNEYLMESRKPSVSELIERIRYRIRALPEREAASRKEAK